MALIAQSDLEARLGRSLTAEEASAFTIINSANQAYVEQIIGSSVEPVEVSTRYFDGGLQHLPIDPCTDIESIKYVDDDQVIEDTVDTTDYTKQPVNRTCKTMIRHRAGAFPTGMNNIAVAAKFSINGDTSILAIIKDALLGGLTSEITASGNIQKESIEGYSVEYASTETKSMLDRVKTLFPEII